MYSIPPGAIARLVMDNGSLVSEAEVAQILESYNYQQDAADQNRWVLMDSDPSDNNAALVFGSNGEIIDVYADSDENILNLNYIAMRIGWADCEIYATNQDIEDKLLLRLVNVGIANSSGLSEARTMEPDTQSKASESVSALTVPATTATDTPVAKPLVAPKASPVEPAIEAMNEDYQLMQQLRVRLAEAEQRSEELAEDKQRLEARILQLESNRAAATPAPMCTGGERPSDDPVLVQIVEKHLLSLLDLSAVNQSDLMTALKQHGYSVDVKLVRQ